MSAGVALAAVADAATNPRGEALAQRLRAVLGLQVLRVYEFIG